MNNMTSIGLVNVTRGENIVYGNQSVDWGGVAQGAMFTVKDCSLIYEVDQATIEKFIIRADMIDDTTVSINDKYLKLLNVGQGILIKYKDQLFDKVISAIIRVDGIIQVEINGPFYDEDEDPKDIEIIIQKWAITLTNKYGGNTKIGAEYCLSSGFTPHAKLPLIHFEGHPIAAMYNASMRRIDEILSKSVKDNEIIEKPVEKAEHRSSFQVEIPQSCLKKIISIGLATDYEVYSIFCGTSKGQAKIRFLVGQNKLERFIIATEKPEEINDITFCVPRGCPLTAIVDSAAGLENLYMSICYKACNN
jgi:hypothetical protein